jgi:hypothetical protein
MVVVEGAKAKILSMDSHVIPFVNAMNNDDCHKPYASLRAVFLRSFIAIHAKCTQ